jgi:Flp pilus assembly protein TadD
MDPPPPDKEAMQPGKTTATTDAAGGKQAKDMVSEKKVVPAAAPVVAATVPQPGKAATVEKKPAVTGSGPAPEKQQTASKPRKKYAKKSVPKRQSPYEKAMAKKKTPTDMGRAAITAGDYQGAIKTLSAVIAKNPEESINYRLRGNAYDNLGKREQAITDWKKAASRGDTIIQSYLVFLQVDWP